MTAWTGIHSGTDSGHGICFFVSYFTVPVCCNSLIKRRDRLIIKDSSIGMESARTYTSVSAKSYKASGTLLAFPGVLDNAYDTTGKRDVSETESEEDSSKRADERSAKDDCVCGK